MGMENENEIATVDLEVENSHDLDLLQHSPVDDKS